MHSIIQFVGAIVVLIGLTALVFGVVMAIQSPRELMTALAIVAGAFSAVISGAILYCFGAIVEHLIAIRKTADAQLRIFADRLGNKQA